MSVRKILFAISFTSVAIIIVVFNPIPTRAAEEVYYIHQDHLGSTGLMTDSGGSVVSKQAYYPYGITRFASGTKLTERQYTGQTSDIDETGLYYYNARYYNPTLAKFTQADKVMGLVNRYQYAGNNPVNKIDATGHQESPPGCGADVVQCFADTVIGEISSDFWKGQSPEAKQIALDTFSDIVLPTYGPIVSYIAAAAVGGPAVAEIVDLSFCAANPDPACIAAATMPGPNLRELGDLKIDMSFNNEIYTEGPVVQKRVDDWIARAQEMGAESDIELLSNLNEVIYEDVQYSGTFTDIIRATYGEMGKQAPLDLFAACKRGVCSQKAQLMYAAMRRLGYNPDLLSVWSENAGHTLVRYYDEANKLFYFYDPTWNFVVSGAENSFDQATKIWESAGFKILNTRFHVPK